MKIVALRALAEKHGILLIYLFGSQAEYGKRYLEGHTIAPDGTSDLDVAVVLDHPSREDIETYGILYRELSELFEPFSVDLSYVRDVDPLLRYEMIKGVRIYAQDDLTADAFEENIMKIAEDLSFKKRVFNREIMEAVEDGYFEFEYKPNA